MATEKLVFNNSAWILYYGDSKGSANQAPAAAFTSTVDSANPLKVSFDATATIGAATYKWNFGDGVTTTLSTPVTSHTYSSAGTRTVSLTAIAPDGTSDIATASVLVSSSGGAGSAYTQDDGNGGTLSSPGSGIQRTGTGYVTLNTTGSDIGAQTSALSSSQRLSLPVGTQQKLKGWSGSTVIHAADVTGGGGIIGAGSNRSIISQVPNSSTGTTYISGTTRDELIRVSAPNTTFQDFQLLGTAQSVTANHGFQISANNVSFIRVKLVRAGKGNDKAPPGETFGISYYNVGDIGTVDDVEIDGQGVGASGFATNGSGAISGSNVIGDYTVNRLYSHNNYYSGCIALWQQNGVATFNDMTVDMSRCFWNIERCAGKVIINRPRIGTLHAATSGWAGGAAGAIGIFCEADSYVGSALANAFRFEIHDPRNLDGTVYTGPRITVNFGSANDGGTQYYGRNQFRAYDAGGNDISTSFYTYGGVPAN